jgi:hypothetical protein
MKIKPNLETFIHLAVIILCLIAMSLVAASQATFKDTKIVYQGF